MSMSLSWTKSIEQPQLEAKSPRASSSRPNYLESEVKQFERLVAVSFVAFLLVAMVGKATGWRFRPWPAGPNGFESVVSEARRAAETYIGLAFTKW